MISELLKYYRPNHSPFQIDNFIVAKEGLTTYGMFKQALREFVPRFVAARDKLHLVDSLSQLEALRELVRFYKIAVALREKLGDFDIDLEESNLAIAKIRFAMASEFIANGRVGLGTVQTILSLPRPIRKILLSHLEAPDELVASVENEVYEVPDTSKVKITDREIWSLIRNVPINNEECKELTGEDLHDFGDLLENNSNGRQSIQVH